MEEGGVGKVGISGIQAFTVLNRDNDKGASLASTLTCGLKLGSELNSISTGGDVSSAASRRGRHLASVFTSPFSTIRGYDGNRSCLVGFVSAPNTPNFCNRTHKTIHTSSFTIVIISTTSNIRTNAVHS